MPRKRYINDDTPDAKDKALDDFVNHGLIGAGKIPAPLLITFDDDPDHPDPTELIEDEDDDPAELNFDD